MKTTPSSRRRALHAARISVGIGSWTDREYTGVIFPRGVKSEERLAVYATHFTHVEVNSSYHRLPRREWVEQWAERTPRKFVFDFKLHRAFAQNPAKAAANPRLVKWVLDTAEPLIAAKKLGAFFLVLPPTFGPEKHRLEELDVLAKELRPHLLAVELRHKGWVSGAQRARTLEYFRSRRLVWIAVDMPRIAGSTLMPPVDEVTNPKLAYLRLHGRNRRWEAGKTAAQKHAHAYTPAELKEIAARVKALAQKARRVHVVANNHAKDFAPRAALALQQLLGLDRLPAR